MKIERALLLAGLVGLGVFFINLAGFGLAALIGDGNSFLSILAGVQVVGVSAIYLGTIAAMAILIFKVLERQPDEVAPNRMGEKPLFRMSRQGTTVFENTEAIKTPVMILHAANQAPPKVQCVPSNIAGNGRYHHRMPDKFEVEESLESWFQQNRGNDND